MPAKALAVPSFPAVGSRQRELVEGTALLALRPLSASELDRVARALAEEGIADVHTMRVQLTARDAHAVSHGGSDPVAATIIPDHRPRATLAANAETLLTEALDVARARGAALQEHLLVDPEMLNTASMGARLGMSEEGVRLKRKRNEILGLEFAKRGIRYPAWQVLADHQLLPGLPQLFAILGNDPWRVFRFLQQHHDELEGRRARDALAQGRIAAVLAAAENTASGAFA